MSITSYLLFPTPGMKNALAVELETWPNCDVIPAENRELLVVVVQSDSKQDEKAFCSRVESLPSLAGYSLVAGFNDANKPVEETKTT